MIPPPAAAALPLAAASLPAWFHVVHLLCAILYVGGILGAARLLALLAGATRESCTTAAALWRRVYLLLTLPAGVVLAGTGVWLLATDPGGQAYMKQGWFHAKLFLVLLIVAADHLLVLRPLRGISRGTVDPVARAAILKAAFPLLLLLATGVLVALFVLRG